MLWCRLPPLVTPIALPVSTSGTVTCTSAFRSTARKSTCTSLRLSGLICASRTIAVTSSDLPASRTVNFSTVLRRFSLSSDDSSSFSLNVTGIGSRLRP